MFSWQEIEEDWLLGAKLALPAEQVLRSFNAVTERFGRDWVEASRVQNGVVTRGTSPTLHVVTLGQWLDSLGTRPNAEHLLDKVRRRAPDARAELAAIHLISSGASDLDLEIEPKIVVGNRNRAPDFRVRRTGEDWTYVEVTQPSTSKSQEDVRCGLARLAGLVDTCNGSFALEVFFKREPTPDEIEVVVAEIASRHSVAGTEAVELDAGLGTLYWNTEPPGMATLDDHGHPYTPRLGAMRVAVQGEAHRHIAIRWPFTDERAQAFLDKESKQLPKDAPGLVMIQTGAAVGAMKAWRSLIEGRFQPTIYTRVSAVCLFSSGQVQTPVGEAWQPQTKLLRNPYARMALPAWIAEQLQRFPSDEEDI